MAHTILVVDDDFQMRQFWTDVLTDQGYAVLAAANGTTGLSLIDQQPPALIIVDMLMPGMNGIEFCRTLRKADATAAIPVIVCSGAQESTIEHECSYTAFFPKPFNLQQLLSAIGAYTASQAHTADQPDLAVECR